MKRIQAIKQLYFINRYGHRYPLSPPSELYGFWPIDLTLDSLITGPSDYDTPSDEIYCPCDAKLPWPSGTVGDAYRIGSQHLKEAHGK